MAAPIGFTKLATIGIVYKGVYSNATTYNKLEAVYYNGDTYVALMDSPVGTPAADGVNWSYLAKGTSVKATADTLGLVMPDGTTIDIDDDGHLIFKSGSATDIEYDNETSKLIATNVQEAIDELVLKLKPVTAIDIDYDNADSTLEAADVKGALDELDTKASTTAKYLTEIDIDFSKWEV